jgi:hypothetical protein
VKTTTKPKKAARSRLDADFLLFAPEVSIFMACFGLVNELKVLNDFRRKDCISEREFDNRFNGVLSTFSLVADATWRFDLLLPVLDYGKFSTCFWRWFNWWDDYIKTLPPMQLSHVEWLAKVCSHDVDQFRPSGDWINHRGDPAFTISTHA